MCAVFVEAGVRRAARRDANEAEIVGALQAVGATVVCGEAFDLTVGYRGRNWLLEIKTKQGRLQPFQKRMLAEWRGQYTVVRTIDEALKAVGAI